MEKATKIPLFRRCVIQNFPFIEEDFDALTDYGLLCKVVEYLNKVINQTNINSEQVEVLSTAFNSLKSYVDNYFDNLDIQDEINTKLEAMAASGQLADIISQYLNSTAIFGYDSVADMKSAENLVAGSFARTLGYYSANDGGGALYKIREIVNTDVVDNGSIIAMDNTDLVAELITSNKVNVKQFGAKGDNSTDDTDAFKNAINYLDKNQTLYIPGGYYIITDNIKFKDTISLVGDSSVPYLVFKGTGQFITIDGHLADEYDYSGYNGNADKKYIMSNLVLTTDDDGYTGKAGTYAIDFDTSDSKVIARSTIHNVRITRFEKGIILPNNNFYIVTFDNISLDNNTNGVYLSYNTGYYNSGERITFINSVIDNNVIAVYLDNLKYDMNFDNCSIDYNPCFIYAPITSTTSGGKISVTNSHYETNFPNLDDTNPHGFFYGNMPYSSLMLVNNIIWTNVKEKQFRKSVTGKATVIYMSNNNFWYVTGDYDYYTLNHYYAIEDFPVFTSNNILGSGDMALPISPYQNINHYPGFTYVNANGTATVDSYKLMDSSNKDTHWRISSPTNITGYSIGSTVNTVNKIYKPLIITNSTIDQSISVDISEDTLLDIVNNKQFYVTASAKNVKNISYVLGWYDLNGTLVVNEGRVTLMSNNTVEDTTLVIPHSPILMPAKNSRPGDAKFKVTFRFEGIEGKNIEVNAMSIYTA